MSFDVLVVGAGPAGAVAATVLARAGARVCLIDRAAFPRPKLCGDTLNPASVSILRRLGLADPVEGAGLRLEGMRVTGDGVAIEGRYPGGLHGLSIRREVLDAMLVEAACRSGAEFREQIRASAPLLRHDRVHGRVAGAACSTASRAAFEIAAPVTIAADGRRSSLALALGLTRHPPHPRRWAIGVHAGGVHGLSPFGEMHIRRSHYIGVAPLPDGIANVCVVRPAEGAEDAFRHPLGVLERALRAEPMLRERFADATCLSRPFVLGPLAVEIVPGALTPLGLLLAGDSAGFVDPMTGDGLRFALRGGELAALAALRALDRGWDGVHASLDDARRREFGGKGRFNRMLRGLVGSPLGVRGATLGGRVAPGIVRALIRHASDCGLAAAG